LSTAWLALGAGAAVGLLSVVVPTVALWHDEVTFGDIKLSRGSAGFSVGTSGAWRVDPGAADYRVRDNEVEFNGAVISQELKSGNNVYVEITVQSYADGNDGLRYSISMKTPPVAGGEISRSVLSLYRLGPDDTCDRDFTHPPDPTPPDPPRDRPVPDVGPVGAGDPKALDPPLSQTAVGAHPKSDVFSQERWCLLLEPRVYQNDVIVTFDRGSNLEARSRWGMYSLQHGDLPWYVCPAESDEGDENFVVTISPELFRWGP